MPPNVVNEPVSLFDQHGRYIGEGVGTAEETIHSDVTTAATDTEVN